jgi:precorrin-2 dehydrogenase/sirohydrochlorin ferrochelatase/precorrin-6A/cobalt-precorrin-6A reductase
LALKTNVLTVFIFAGTGDGKKFILALLDEAEKNGMKLEARIFCATEYGGGLVKNEIAARRSGVSEKIRVSVHCGRLTGEEMANEITRVKPDYVIDCTHPFAEAVTQNIKSACENTGVPCLRLLREPSPIDFTDVFYVDSAGEAASFLENKTGNIFLTTGSKELRHFASKAFSGRVYPRVLPLTESLLACREAGIAEKNIIAMQGPFPLELNRAVIRHINASWLVSKGTGAEGGFAEKINAALAENCRALVIRPPKEEGLDADAIIRLLMPPPAEFTHCVQTETGSDPSPQTPSVSGVRKKFFPVFQNVTNKKFLIAGAGAVALRRVKTLLNFDCRVEIIAPDICPGIKNICDERVNVRQDFYREGGCEADFVIAATNDRAVNKMIASECKAKNIPVSVADRKEESTFYFPAVICTDKITAGVTSDGSDHGAVSAAAQKIRVSFVEGA